MASQNYSVISTSRKSPGYSPSGVSRLASGNEYAVQAYPFTYQEITELIQPASMSLCMIDRNFCLSPEDAEVLYAIFGRNAKSKQASGGHSFLSIIDSYLIESKKKQVRKYLRYLFSNAADARLVQQKNPLRCVTLTSLNQGKGSSTSHYEFNFKPLVRKGVVERILISIEDISKAIAMEYSIVNLKKIGQSSAEQLSSITSMLQFEKEIIIEFLLSTSASFKEVRKLVQESSPTMEERNKKLDEIFRIAHQVKGDAAALGFKFLAQESHNFESILDELKFRQGSVSNKNDLLVLVDPLKKMIEKLVNIRTLVNNLTDSEWSHDASRELHSDETSTVKKLSSLVNKMSEDSQKRLKIVDDFSHVAFPENLRGDIQDILVQLTRNAMVHGIEVPAVRKQRFKTEYGCLHICASKTNKMLSLTVRDDGAGVDIDKIRASALASGKYSPSQIASWRGEDIFNLLKTPGFSTASTLSSHAGRGVGLDLIDSKVKKLGGGMTMSSKKGLYTQFTLTFPL